jgi:integrase
MPTKTRRKTKQTPKPPPEYRQRPGRTQALVTLTDAATKQRRDYWLGEYGTPESREAYHQIIAEWEARGRRLPPPRSPQPAATSTAGPAIVELANEFLRFAEEHQDQKHHCGFKTAFAVLRRHFGQVPAAEFGPKKLRTIRDAMIHQAAATRDGRVWCRKYINAQVQRIRQLFKWGAAHERVPVSVCQSLATLDPLRRGRTAARELLDAVRPFLNRPVRALVELQLLTGARTGELLGLRPCDVEMDEEKQVWLYRPEQHKNAFREQERVVFFGPKAQKILRPFLRGRPLTAYMFSPAEADAERRKALHNKRVTPDGHGNRPGTKRRENPKRKPGERYTTASYYRSIRYACDRAFPLARVLRRKKGENHRAWAARLGERWAEVVEWWKQHRFHPHQLRHNAATLLRREFGLEAAQLALGHASAQITDAVYAERDRARVIEIMRKIG